MTQNELYELVADFGEAYGTGLRRDSYLAHGIDWPENWLEISGEIGDARATELFKGLAIPSPAEMKALIRWQVEDALDKADPNITPMLWLCQQKDDDIIAVEGWGNTLHTELKFRLIGRFPDETAAILAMNKEYYFSVDDFD